ncbi:diuretic hormone 37 like protein isoform X2 [Tribolium castaneum]|uniref:diuretic hormone 37 like protein isoform X2 n=1 Tax=Tribolium castaneum TaxID=7070 RepID=UPI00046C2F2B|nr:PREDICTED: diuretic hormone 37 like protein isoform X2 [Tribolium castaneum]|eukprot:XP_008200100.1 PREDICTED: diuretic hormone 37 like protein isoform X2 [Tribolium castaneum]
MCHRFAKTECKIKWLVCSWCVYETSNVRIMRVPVYLVCAALVVVVRSEERTNYYGGRYLEPVDVAADQETVSYLLPKLAAKYRPNSEWSGVTDPRFYVLTEMESQDIENQNKLSPESRSKRAGALGESGASLSIVNSLDVLRNRLLLEIARKKAKEGANRNRQILLSLGKRAFLQSRASGTYDNNV